MISKQDDILLRAATGLEGGVVASGSTCGVVTGGALGLALLYDNELREGGAPAEAALLALAGEYVRWFEGRYRTSFCRDRTGVDFYTVGGQLRYFVPDRVGRCLWHIGGAVRHLHAVVKSGFPADGSTHTEKRVFHCARDVLRGIREQTGTGYDLLERASVVFDGGLGLQGGVCGALAGAIMGINLKLGLDIRRMGFFQTAKAFIIGHLNLLKKKPVDDPEPFAVGRGIVKSFRERAGTLECRAITGRTFSGWDDFQDYLGKSSTCQELIKLMVDEASKAIKRFS